MSTTFVLPRLLSRDGKVSGIAKFLLALSSGKAWRITVEEERSTRSIQQNRFLWGSVYPTIQKHLPGWSAEDIHEYCLGECYGWEMLEGFGKRRMRPIRRSSKLSTTEFMDYIADIQQRMAGHGIYIADPNEDLAEPLERVA